MNSKKAKKLRQLVKVMQEKGVVDKEWIVEGTVKHDKSFIGKTSSFDFVSGDPSNKNFNKMASYQSMLKPECGRAVYKNIKKRAS